MVVGLTSASDLHARSYSFSRLLRSSMKGISMSDKKEDSDQRAKIIDRDKFLRACADLAHQPSILDNLAEQLRKQGFAGSTNIPATVFLSMITRMFEQPVSLVLKGQSGSGKSFSLHAGMQFIPESAYHEVHGLSQKALLHAAKTNLKHRFLVIQEAAGFAKDGWVFLRQMLTEGKLNYMSVGQTREGHEGKELPTVEGPMGVMMTTTANSLHGEDETRMLSLYVDQSPEQIRRALMIHAGPKPSKPSREILSRWHALHDYVCSGPLDVVMPYRNELISKLPTSHMRVLRDIPKVIALISAHALLHQCNRRVRDGAVIANLDDYSKVYSLVSEPLSFGLRASVPPHIADVVRATLDLFKEKGTPITQVEVATRLIRDQSVVGRNLHTAIKDGYLVNENTGQGRPHAYIPGDRELPSQSVLPTPAELRSAIELSAGSTNRTAADVAFDEQLQNWPQLVPAH